MAEKNKSTRQNMKGKVKAENSESAEQALETMTDEQISLEERRLELEERRLRVEQLRTTVARERAIREQKIRDFLAQQEAMDANNQRIIADQASCSHRKGGKNLEGIRKGHDSNYSVQQITYPWGEVRVMCSRCTKEWKKPAAELQAIDPQAYARQLAEYNTALNWPTDNEPSGTQIFQITRTAVAASA